MEQIRSSNALRGILAAVFVLAMLCRLFMPSGFMPIANHHGFAIQLCDGGRDPSMALDLDKKPSSRDEKSGNATCPFAAGGSGNFVVPSPVVSELFVFTDLLLTSGIPVRDSVVLRLAAPPPPAIGPPVTA